MANKPHTLACVLGLSALALALPGHAEDAATQPIVVGAASERLLDMQREGAYAANLQPIPGEVASRSYRRYLDSFAKPMPEFKETVASSTKSDANGSK